MGHQEKIAARKAAEESIKFLEQMEEGDVVHYWKILRDLVLEKAPYHPSSPTSRMTDLEAARFGNREMLFGKHEGKRICEVPVDYLDWLVGEPGTFYLDLKRYLQNMSVARKVAEAIEVEEDNGDVDSV